MSHKLLRLKDSVLKSLLERSQNGDSKSRDELLAACMAWVKRKCRHYGNKFPRVDLDNLIYSSIQGLLRSIDNFDPGLGIPFDNYARQMILSFMDKELRSEVSNFSLLQNGRRKAQKLLEACESLKQDLGRSVTLEEVREKLDWAEREIQTALHAMYVNTGTKEARHYVGLSRLIQTMGYRDEITQFDLDDWHKALGKIGDRERKILELRLGLTGWNPMTLKKVGKVLSLSRERIRQIEKRGGGRPGYPAATRTDPAAAAAGCAP